MLHRLVLILSFLWMFSSCSTFFRPALIASYERELKKSVQIGDDIFRTQEKLEKLGYKVEFGPGFMGPDEAYYSMIVSYGLNPTIEDKIRSATDNETHNQRLATEITANLNGIITTIGSR